MKKIFLLSILLFQLTFVFGQEVTYAWGPWVQNPCFKGLQSRCKVKDYNSSAKQYTWDIEIKNNYSSKVSFNFDIQNSSIDGRTSINPGGIDKGWTLNPSSTNLYVEFSKVCFDPNDYCSINSNGTQNKGYKCYAECDNGVPNVPKLCGNTNSQSNSTNQTNSTNQQNDLSEYNRSKAEMEQKLAEKNAEITRQNQENARLGQIWNNAIKAGVDAHNSGNYTEAKNQFTIAINNSSNETNRQNAQNYYNKSVEAEKSQGKIKAIGEIAQGTIQILGNAHEKKMQKLNAELDENNQKLKIIEDDKVINTLTDSKTFETYVNYVTKNLEELNFKFEKIAFFSNIPNKEKNIGLNFEGLEVNVSNRWDGSSMTKSIIFKFASKNIYNNNITKPFFENLKLLYPFYDNFSAKLNSYEHSNFIVFGLEKTQPFIDIYKNEYKSNTYKGFVNELNEFQNIAKQKLAKTNSSTKGLIEKAELYKSGLGGVEKNNEKALELYQQAYDKSKDKEILLKIGQLYQENKNFEKAITYFEEYKNNNENINPIVYSNLGWIYKDDSSQFYNLEKAKSNFENKIKILEENYKIENEESKKTKLKKEISFTYSVLAFMYNYYGKNVTPTISIPYYEKAMEWNEDDESTAFQLMRLYAKDWDNINFKRDTKKAKYWALKVCEIAKRLEIKNSGSHEAKMAKMNCTTANDHISNNFKYLKK